MTFSFAPVETLNRDLKMLISVIPLGMFGTVKANSIWPCLFFPSLEDLSESTPGLLWGLNTPVCPQRWRSVLCFISILSV